MTERLNELPLQALESDFLVALTHGSILLEAEPGAGKSTLAPLWVLNKLGGQGQIWLIQPRILAVCALANRLAALVHDKVGGVVGYHVPFESRSGDTTQLLVMTPGILLQRLLADSELTGVAAVMLDEVHERSVQQDIAWALLQEAQVLREDLQLVLMSATPDRLLRKQVAQALYSPGRCFPVDVSYCPPKILTNAQERIEDHLLRALSQSPGWQRETVLVFLPGWRDIERCQRALSVNHPNLSVFTLHSRVGSGEQLAALDPASGPRVILATNIAETSLTIADVTLVVDAGLVREPDYQQRTGVSRLQTRRISAASAEQRRGRAGRVQAGHCIRLWAESEHLPPQTLPEIRRCDYLPMVLQLAHWGTAALELPWLEAPGEMAIQQAQRSLRQWQLLDECGAITKLGQKVSSLGTHPRIAALLLHTVDFAEKSPWLLLLALAMHFDLPGDGDIEDWLRQAEREYRLDRRWAALLRRWCRVLEVDVKPSARWEPLAPRAAQCLAMILADRIGHSDGDGRYRINSGVTVELANRAPWVLVLQVSTRGKSLVGVATDLQLADEQVRQLATAESAVEQQGAGRKKTWYQIYRYRLGGKLVATDRAPVLAADIPAAIVEAIQSRGLASLHWSQEALSLLLRARLALRHDMLDLPALDADALLANLGDWLSGFLNAQSDIEHLPFKEALVFYLGHESVQALAKLLPPALTLPSGRKLSVDYSAGGDIQSQIQNGPMSEPRIAAKLQEFFGAEHFTLPASQVPLAIELLSPAGRPLAITRDLAFFWRDVYPDVRREMRGRYAKHPWPEDPLDHSATHLTKRKLES
ncbi:ATP-dependent helicase HrpB [Gilvimarinus sp. SDUM040013]|uniref:ATP-dependent helicase HrpB n=1 Tax=Gilvimarinus gilvus TaxID=3058038 RepID=A0ABU4RZP8_9GAMM|nr:ATP-dependent helicase HrpB [Gilvimarinus sp. SDUM040013]MDO3386517.1 ATP-dependent helicase HrpB [Gilvimarinus sp. SDUM040013]MDX6849093.1 ATP-dependent helicase HrpB [Gilvimarinus sp. SDUM040013]